MKKWFLLLQLLLLAVVVSVIYWWPASPVWERAIGHGRILGFDATSQRVMTISSSNPSTRLSDLTIHRFDVTTGSEVDRKTFAGENNWWVCDCHLINNQTQIFLAREFIDPSKYNPEQEAAGNWPIRPKTYELLDAATFQRIAGPFPFEGQRWPAFSPNGKWIWSILYGRGDITPTALIEADTGRIVREFRPSSGCRPSHAAGFSPDGSAMAIQWIDHTNKQWSIEIVNLPDGKTRFVHTLPNGPWSVINHWADNRLYLETNTSVAPQCYRIGCSSLEVQAGRLGEPREEPSLTGFVDYRVNHLPIMSNWKFVGDMQIQLQHGSLDNKPDWFNATLEWFDEKAGTSLRHPKRVPTMVRLSERNTGRQIAELRSTRLGYPWMIAVSPDCNYVASIQQGYEPTGMGLLLWNAQPGSRWPWAWGAGIGSVIVLRLIVKRLIRSRGIAVKV
ncbi:MAG: hypothetical protein JNJ77_04735 [Planctomycetia bacterium]|nr:hypothetical protein [Planctomycetia bacterium]